jgi:homoserine O-acetyltransferase
VLGIERLHAVMGISMGGMQAFEWSVAHPDELGRAVSIVGTPQLTSHDLHLWSTELHALEDSVAYAGGNYRGRPKIRAVQDIHWLMLTTPRHRARETSRDAYATWAEEKEADTEFDWNDWHRQAEAMLTHDIARAHGGSLEAVAKTVKAKMLVIVADQDHMVLPEPAKAFAKAMGDRAELVVLDTDCGHFAPGCSSAEVEARVRTFLAN